MGLSIKLGSIARIPIRVHLSFFLLFVLIWGSNRSASLSELAPAFLWVLALFACVTVHELSHCAVARRRGLVVQDIMLLPFGGVSQIKGLTDSGASTERDVAIVGPLTNFVLAAVFFGIALATGAHLWPPLLTSGSWFARLAWLNVVLGAFNLLPALPMDGGRVLRAILARHGNVLRATQISSGIATVIGVGMIIAGMLPSVDNLILSFIGVFVILGAFAERRVATINAAVSNVLVGNVMAQDPTSVLAEVTVGQIAPWLASFPGRAVPIVDQGSYLGMIGMEDILAAPPEMTLGEVADKSSPVLEANQSVYPDAITAFSQTPRLQIAVISGGRVVGVLYRWTVQNLVRQYSRPGSAAA